MTVLRILPLTAAVLVMTACADDDTKGRVPLANGAGAPAGDAASLPARGAPPPGMTAVSAALLDSGNVAFRVKQYAVAQQYYERAAAEVPDQAAPWYGVYMVAQATKNQPLSDSAMKMVSQRSGGGDLIGSDMGKAHEGAAKR
jgi:hypothetical protein